MSSENNNKRELHEEERSGVSGGRVFNKTDRKCPVCGKYMGCKIDEWLLERKYFCKNCGHEENG